LRKKMRSSFEETLTEVWRQVLVEGAKTVALEGKSYPVLKTPKNGLRQVDFAFDGREIRGLEQNSETRSRWAQMAASGKKVMQFLSRGRYIGVVAEGKVNLYGKGTSRS
jgi:hypothetical protein